DLFVMGATLANAEHMLHVNHADQTPQDLADLFCKNARQRIEQNFRLVKKNHNRKFNEVADELMAGKLRWLATDVYQDLPPGYRDYAKNQYTPKGAEDMAPVQK
ncbi:MAG: hypothetical protein HYV26_08220, partial [Candidatus Hydrogenedentes bacterium]|nr:hypothetical protein [Candidatus Hydrogenedentota bacterium]